MNIINERPIMVFANDFNGTRYYKVGISKKNTNGDYINGYVPCKFKKGIEIHNQTKIIIKKAWLDFYIDKNNKTNVQIFISEFDYDDITDIFKEDNNDDLPF